MKNSKFVIDKIAKLFEQGLISSKDLASELNSILKSKRVENLEKKFDQLKVKKKLNGQKNLNTQTVHRGFF